MSSTEDFNSSSYEIEKAILKPYLSPNGDVGNTESNRPGEDISSLITGFVIEQSINAVSLIVRIKVIDKSNLLETVPLRAEETIDLTVLVRDLNERIELKLRVFKIDNITFNGQMTGTGYTLHCVSQTTYDSTTRKVTAPWQGKIADAAKFFFDNYFGKTRDSNTEDLPYNAKRFNIIKEQGRSLTVQDTDGIVDFIIPNYKPAKAMNFMASRAYNPNTPSQTFRFFETIDGFWFVTDEYFFKQPREDRLNLFYALETKQLDDPEMDVKRIDKMSIISTGRNVAEHIYSGAYKSKVLEIDLVRGEVIHHPYSYLEDTKFVDSDGEIVKGKNSPHSTSFIEDTFTDENAKDMIVFKDYASIGDIPGSLRGEQYFPTIAQNRIAYYHHLHDVQLSIETKGRADIRPGKVIDLNIQLGSLESGGELNPQLNGRYLVSDTFHGFNEGMLTTTAKVLKLNWSGTAVEDKVEDVSQ